MGIPQTITIDNREYEFIKQCNEKLYLYKEKKTGYKETFSKFDLGLVEQVYKKVKDIHPEKNRYF